MAWRHVPLFILAPLLFAPNARAGDKEPTAIVELGPAGEWGLPGPSSYGPSLAVEFTPIKDWFEIEVGAARMFHGGHGEWDTDILFKKPFTLSDKVEFMVGVGPQWTFSREGAQTGVEPSTSCSGPPRIESSDGSWSRLTATPSAGVTSNRSAPPSDC
jgi:hypothetical protein